MQINLTDHETLEYLIGLIGVPGLEQRDPGRMGELQVKLNALKTDGKLNGYENGAAYIAAVRDALKTIPSLTSSPDDNAALNMAVHLIDVQLKHDRALQPDSAQRGV